MPGIVIEAGDVEGAPAAIVGKVGAIPDVPGADVTVVHEYVVAVVGIGHVFVDQTDNAAGRRCLEPRRDGQWICIQSVVVGDGDDITGSVKGRCAADLSGDAGSRTTGAEA